MRQGTAALSVLLLLMATSCDAPPKGDTLPVGKELQEPEEKPVSEDVVETNEAKSKLIDVEREEMRVARLQSNEALSELRPSEYCLDDGKLWKGARFRLGRVNVFGLDDALDALAALDSTSLVAIVGETKVGLDSRLEVVGPCPKGYEPVRVQMRSDWIAPEGGPISTHERLKSLPYQEGRSAMSVHMVDFLPSASDKLRVRIQNPFTLPLAGLHFDAHYEGGGGKPMPTLVAQVVALAPGASTEIELPRELDSQAPPTKAGSGLHSLKLQGRLGKADLDIEIFVPH